MNAYNENLHANVVTSLQNMEQELKTVSSASNAAMFTLYYAEGATITAMEKLSAAKDSQSFQENVKTQAVKNNNLSNNLLASATQAGAYLKQSVSNTSVAAANVQQAANAIVRLSSDIGSIYNIVQAANADTDIFNQAREANQLIKKTAYDAEIASQTAMEASIFTSKVSGNVVLDKAKSTNAAVGDLLKTTSTDFDNISQTVSDDNAALASASASEKLAEGVFEDSNTVTGSTASAYKLTNRELNNNLVAKPVPGQESTSFIVSFNTIRSPFFERSTKPLYPVQNYYLIVAKEKQKTTFTMSNAENIIQNLPTQCINLQMDKIPFFIPGSEYKAQFDFLAITGADGNTYALRDSDGDAITTGVDYVVFLLAVYHEDYKKKLNTFDDYLSAPSALFTFTNYLAIAKITSVPAANLMPPQDDTSTAPPSTTVAASNGVPTIGISVSENADFSGQVEYRCILLPANNNLGLSGMANMESLAELDDEIKKLEVIASELDPQIAATEDRLMETRAQVTQLAGKYPDFFPYVLDEFRKFTGWLDSMIGHQSNEDIATFFIQMLKAESSVAATLNDDMEKDLVTFVLLLVQEYVDEQELEKLNMRKMENEGQIMVIQQSRVGFIFNLALAEQVSAGNYIKANMASTTPAGGSIDTQAAKPGKGKKAAGTTPQQFSETNWLFTIDENATDNFGNMLVRGNNVQGYIPVILSISTAGEGLQSKFTNTWTGYNNSPVIYFY